MSSTRSEEAAASSKPVIKIIHIKQMHRDPFAEPAIVTEPKQLEMTAQSQFQIAQELRKYKGLPIVDEGNYDNKKDAKSQPIAITANKIFPEGFPSHYHQLTKLQKEFLYDQGAAHTLFYLGEIPAIYRCTRVDGVVERDEFFKKLFASIKSNPRDEMRELCFLSTKEESDSNIKLGKIYIRPLKGVLEYALLDNDNKTINRGKITAKELGKKIDESLLKADSAEVIKKCKPLVKKMILIIKQKGHLSERLVQIVGFKDPVLEEHVHDSREKEAIACAKEAAMQHFGKLEGAQVIIIFGGAHDFKPHLVKEGIAYEEIDASMVQKQVAVSSSPDSFFNFSKLSDRFSDYLKERELRGELQLLLRRGKY